MFDTVGRHPDVGGAGRRVLAVVHTTWLLGSVCGAALWWVSLPQAPLPASLESEDLAEVVLLDETVALIAPPPPLARAPRPTQGRRAGRDVALEASPLPEELPEAAEELVEVAAAGLGGTGGSGRSEAAAPPEEVDAEPGVQEFRYGALRLRSAVPLPYPRAARRRKMGERQCVAEVSIAADGVPEAVEVHSCPDVFHEATRQAILAWRYDPPMHAGHAVRARTRFKITFRLRPI
jgi:outer membrane biosynthesis protein TonB